ncbi:MAG: fibrillin [Euryarchaeota archaeon]|nr:fibrillin [Euryarchaeota archaeon]
MLSLQGSDYLAKRSGKGRRNPPGRKVNENLRLGSREVWTRNADSGKSVYGETRRDFSGEEWRRWSANRSKICAGLLCARENPDGLIPNSGDDILYLGAGHGTTISHLHDVICGPENIHSGRIVGVDIAPRCLRDLTFLAKSRKGIIPVLGDARKYAEWQIYVPNKVNWIFQDVAQSAQVDIFLGACQKFLNHGGTALLSLKAASERWTKEGEKALFDSVGEKIANSGLEIVEAVDISRYEENHVLFHCVKKAHS